MYMLSPLGQVFSQSF